MNSQDSNKVALSGDGHKCYGEQEGDWVVFRCPVCEDYERRIHLKTGEMKSQYNKDNLTPHHGFYLRPVVDIVNQINPN